MKKEDLMKDYNIKITEVNDWGKGRESVVIHSIHKDLGVVGEAVFAFDRNKLEITPGNTSVKQDHRRKGLATAMYKLAESYAGVKLTPSKDQSDDAKIFWEYYSQLD